MNSSSTFTITLTAWVACSLALAAQSARIAAWSDANYQRFTPQSFANYAPAARVLDRNTVDHNLLDAAVFYATNAARVSHGLAPLRFARALHESAYEHSCDMAAGNFFAHENPKNAAKRTPWQRMAAKGVSGGNRAENIAARFVQNATYLSCASQIVKQWMDSPGHRANILNGKFTYLGCGVHPCGCPQFHLFATQNFASIVP